MIISPKEARDLLDRAMEGTLSVSEEIQRASLDGETSTQFKVLDKSDEDELLTLGYEYEYLLIPEHGYDLYIEW